MIVPGGQQRDSALHVHVSILPQTPLPSRLPHNRLCFSLPLFLEAGSVCGSSCGGAFRIPLPSTHGVVGGGAYTVRENVCCAVLSRTWLYLVVLFETPPTVVRQSPLSVGILKARILEWIAMPFSRGSPQPRDQTQVSHFAGRFFTS